MKCTMLAMLIFDVRRARDALADKAPAGASSDYRSIRVAFAGQAVDELFLQILQGSQTEQQKLVNLKHKWQRTGRCKVSTE